MSCAYPNLGKGDYFVRKDDLYDKLPKDPAKLALKKQEHNTITQS